MALELEGITKHYGPVRANDGVTFTVPTGQLHGLVGENGAGKSTLATILSGYRRADAGTVRLDGRRVDVGSPRSALKAGFGLLHQDPLVLANASVLENFLLGQPGRLHRADGRRRLAAGCQRLGFDLAPDRTVRTLSPGERQQLEIVRLLDAGATVLILDEPTTAISAEQRDQLFAALRELAADGLTVLYVTHKLEELDALCERVTVLRQGKAVGQEDVGVPHARLVELMFGSEPALEQRPAVELGKPVLVLDHVTTRDGNLLLRDVDLSVHAGEVIGLAGLEGQGQRALLRVAAGQIKPLQGRVLLGGDDVTREPFGHRRAAGLELLPADRLAEGLIPGLDVGEHLAIAGAIPRRAGWRRVLRDPAAERAAADQLIAAYRVKGTPASTPEMLSGGNQQRLLLGLAPESLTVLLMEHPTRGLDVASAEEVWARLSARREQGTGIVFASSDLDELKRWADRICICYAGRVVAEVPAAGTSTEELGHLIGGSRKVPAA